MEDCDAPEWHWCNEGLPASGVNFKVRQMAGLLIIILVLSASLEYLASIDDVPRLQGKIIICM